MTRQNKFKNSKYKNWSQDRLIDEYVKMAQIRSSSKVKNVGAIIGYTILGGVIGLGLSYILYLTVMDYNSTVLWIVSTIGLLVGFVLSLSSFLFYTKKEQIYYFVKNKKKLQNKLEDVYLNRNVKYVNESDAREQRIRLAEEKENRARKQEIDATLNKINNQLDKPTSKESYDLYNKNGKHIGRIDKN